MSQIFISYDTIDDEIAIDLAHLISKLSAGICKGFVAGNDLNFPRIPQTQKWRKAIRKAVKESQAIIALITPNSIKRPWVTYELGVAEARRIKVGAIVLGMRISELGNYPITDRQLASDNVNSVTDLLVEILKDCPTAEKDREKIAIEVNEFLYKADGIRIARQKIKDVEKRHISYLTDQVHKDAAVSIRELDAAKRLSEDEYIDDEITIVGGLNKGDELHAICGDKDWNFGGVYTYLVENIEAVKRGVKVTRIYIQPPVNEPYEEGFHAREWAVIDYHLHLAKQLNNFDVRVLLGLKASKQRDNYRLPKGFGLLITKCSQPVAMMHYGFSVDYRKAVKFRNKWIIETYEKMFRAIMRRISDPKEVQHAVAQAKKEYHPPEVPEPPWR
ncbi:MAG: toll/interleukin-1 receptor domain-containing protein [Bacteroidetes bacterium]|nr:toll/interleukin-1 receptor domain-containing protein [Bacteroidota bacterium]